MKENNKDIKILTVNKKAYHNYEILDTIETGIALKGSEVKSAKMGHINIRDSFAIIDKGEVFLINAHFAPYQYSSYDKVDPYRRRKLLLHRREIDRLAGKLKTRGLTLVPLKVYIKNGKIKVELGLAKGKKKYDKREEIKERDLKREMEREIKEYRSKW
jgi:SsrA-binding protein